MHLDPIFAPLVQRAPRLPDGVRVYAVGDVHGRLDLLTELQALIDADAASAAGARVVQVMLGDYIDRGPASREVVDRLIEQARQRELVTLRGNHEDYVLQLSEQPERLAHWWRFGGREGLLSYGLDLVDPPIPETVAELVPRALAAIPPEHRAFFAATGLSWRCGDYFFAHAGVRPGIPLHRQAEQDLLWIRGGFLEDESDFGAVVVHGHTPGPAPVVRANRICIDTGAYASGVLTCLVLEGADQRLLQTGR